MRYISDFVLGLAVCCALFTVYAVVGALDRRAENERFEQLRKERAAVVRSERKSSADALVKQSGELLYGKGRITP